MSILFSPATQRDAGNAADLRVVLVTANSRAKSDDAKWMGFDFRLHPDVVKAWGLRSGDKIVARLEDDGSWVFTLVLPTEKGYVARIGGVPGHNGRKGYAYCRFTAMQTVARKVFPQGEVCDLEFVGIDGRSAMFVPAKVASGVEFVPAN